jgi:hypothetical protein
MTAPTPDDAGRFAAVRRWCLHHLKYGAQAKGTGAPPVGIAQRFANTYGTAVADYVVTETIEVDAREWERVCTIEKAAIALRDAWHAQMNSDTPVTAGGHVAERRARLCVLLRDVPTNALTAPVGGATDGL